MSDYNLYIHSKNRNESEKSYNFSLYLQNPIICNDNEAIRVDVMNFFMINTMYNISSLLNNYTFQIDNVDLSVLPNTTTTSTYSIPFGNYSVLQFRDTLNNLLSGKISVSYNYQSNTYTLTKTNNNFNYFIKNIKCGKALNLSDNTEITLQGITTNYINLVEYQQIIIKSDLIYEDLNQDNIVYLQDDKFNLSQILFWCNKQDIEPFKCITYTNIDAGDSFSYNIRNTNISKISFKIMNENDILIKDCPEWFLHLKFHIYKKNNTDYDKIFNIIINLLNDIKYIMTRLLFGVIRK
jgi:hypothetical protein